jgi:hypothetical protein
LLLKKFNLGDVRIAMLAGLLYFVLSIVCSQLAVFIAVVLESRAHPEHPSLIRLDTLLDQSGLVISLAVMLVGFVGFAVKADQRRRKIVAGAIIVVLSATIAIAAVKAFELYYGVIAIIGFFTLAIIVAGTIGGADALKNRRELVLAAIVLAGATAPFAAQLSVALSKGCSVFCFSANLYGIELDDMSDQEAAKIKAAHERGR